MRTPLALSALLLGLTLSPLAHAQGPAAPITEPKEDPFESGTTGFELGLRTGFALPLGKLAARGDDLSDFVAGQIPIWLDVGYRITPGIYVGGYGQYGFGFAKNCPEGISCSVRDIRIGVDVQYHPTPFNTTDPWIGLGFGYEFLNYSASAKQGGRIESADSSGKGWEFANFQGGVDFRVTPTFRLGPFASLSIDQTSTITFGNQSSSDFDKALHMWLFFGVRGAFVLGGS